MMSIEDELVFDIAQMHKPLTPLLDEWNEGIAEGVPYEPNPSFIASSVVGGADADIAIADLLVDVKTHEEISNSWLRGTLFQLLGYTLLDLDDSLEIRRLGILLPRQPHIEIWDVSELLGRDAEEALPELREQFAEVLGPLLHRDLYDEAEA